MPDTNDPILVKSQNEGIRPMAERLRAMKLTVDSLILDIETNVLPEISKLTDDTVIQDGREAEGVHLRTVGEFREFYAILKKVVQPGSDTWPDDLIAAFCVRGVNVG